MSSQQPKRDESAKSGASSGKSDYQMLKDQGFSGKKDFMESHGLKVWNHNDHQEAKAIMDAYRKYDEMYGQEENAGQGGQGAQNTKEK